MVGNYKPPVATYRILSSNISLSICPPPPPSVRLSISFSLPFCRQVQRVVQISPHLQTLTYTDKCPVLVQVKAKGCPTAKATSAQTFPYIQQNASNSWAKK